MRRQRRLPARERVPSTRGGAMSEKVERELQELFAEAEARGACLRPPEERIRARRERWRVDCTGRDDRAGYLLPTQQVEVPDPLHPGRTFCVDFVWVRADGRVIVGECDGLRKLLNPEMARGAHRSRFFSTSESSTSTACRAWARRSCPPVRCRFRTGAGSCDGRREPAIRDSQRNRALKRWKTRTANRQHAKTNRIRARNVRKRVLRAGEKNVR